MSILIRLKKQNKFHPEYEIIYFYLKHKLSIYLELKPNFFDLVHETSSISRKYKTQIQRGPQTRLEP